MLRLRAQIIQRIGSSHVCATCLVPTTRRPLASGLSQSAVATPKHFPRHTASFFTSSPLCDELPEASHPPKDLSESPGPESNDAQPTKKRERRRPKRAARVKAAKSAVSGESEKLEKSTKSTKSLKSTKSTKSAKSAKAERSEKSGKPEKPSKSGKLEKPEKPEKPGKAGKAGKRPGKPNSDRANDNLQRLRGALAALETVLSEQNIQVGRPKKSKKRAADMQEAEKGAKDDEPRAKGEESGDDTGTTAPSPVKTAPSKSRKTRVRKKATKAKKAARKIEFLHAEDLNLVPIERAQPPVLPLAYGLDRVLFNPGVYNLQDPRSRVFNFDPYLANIMPIKEFDFAALKQYVTSSKDETLIGVARENNKTYTGSTSSMTSMLSHFHYLLSGWREINTDMLSKGFEPQSRKFTKIMRAPAAVFLHYKDGVYAIDADKEYDRANILSMLGKSMEKMLTLPTDEYERYRRINSDQITEEERNADEAFHYTGLGDFMMRSQLDAHDHRLPGTGMYDLKTRAVVSIRMDVRNFEKGLGYEIRHRQGEWESYEREYYDMIRAAFLKYSLQVRMGRMDGIFVAFHNVERIFGFQYVPLEEMDLTLHGTDNKFLGDSEFRLSLGLLNQVLDRAKNKFPEQSLRLHFEARGEGTPAPFMYIFAKPVTSGEIQAVQDTGKEAIEKFENELLYGKKDDEETDIAVGLQDQAEGLEDTSGGGPEELQTSTDAVEQENTVASWEDIQAVVEDAVEDEELGMGAVREAIESALEESGLLEVQSPEESRGYVEALLDAVTDHIRPSREESTEALEDNETDNAVDEPTESNDAKQQPISQEQSAAASEGTRLETRREDEDIEMKIQEDESRVLDSSATTSEQEPASDDVETDVQDEAASAEAGFKDESSSSPSISSLRRLILHMTRSLEEKQLASQGKLGDDSSKLQEFEEILRRLIARSRQDQEGEQEVKSSEPSSTLEHTEIPAPENTGAGSTGKATEEETSAASPDEAEGAATPENPEEEVLGMVLTIRNKVNDSYVVRPGEITERDTWTVEYHIEELDRQRTNRLYSMCKRRRQVEFDNGEKSNNAWEKIFAGQLQKYTAAGRDFREKEMEFAKTQPVLVYGEDGPRTFEEVFGTHQHLSSAEEFRSEEKTNDA